MLYDKALAGRGNLVSGIEESNHQQRRQEQGRTKGTCRSGRSYQHCSKQRHRGKAQHPFPIPFGLWIYNRFERYEKGFGKWIFKKLAAKPVYVSTVNPETRIKVASNLLHDYGYFDGKVTYRVDSTRNPRAVKLSYDIDMGNPYYIDTVTYEGFRPQTDSLIHAHFDERLIHSGDNFDVTVLNQERQRLIDLFRDNGYYYARNEFITFLADTIMRKGTSS